MTRVLLVTNDFPPTTGGIQSYLRDYVAQLPPDNVVVLASTQDSDAAAAYDSACDYEIFRMPQRVLLPTPRVARELKRLIKEKHIDTVWFGASAPLGLLARVARSAGATRVVASTHGHEVGWSMLPIARQLLRFIGNHCDSITYISQYTYRRLRGSFGDHPSYVHVPGGVEAHAFRRPPESYSSHNSHTVVCVSRLVPRKGQDSLIRAWPAVLEQVPDAQLILAGRGPYEKKLRTLARGVPNVSFVGRIDDSELPRLLHQAAVFAMPVRTRGGGLDVEGLGIVFLEAQAAGLPVVVGRSGGAPETVTADSGVVIDGRNIAALSQVLVELLASAGRREAMGIAGVHNVEAHWTWDVLGERLRATLAVDGGTS